MDRKTASIIRTAQQAVFPFLGGVFLFLFSMIFIAYLFRGRVLFDTPYSTVLLDRNGDLLGARISADEQWRLPPSKIIPQKYKEALITFEDKRFWYHPGIDPLAVARAVYLNLSRREIVSGGSTITMQTIRLSRRNKPRSYREKGVEALLALLLDLSYSKEDILNLYASHAPFGGNVVGVEAASWRYFGHPSSEVSWSEAALLAVLPNAPSLIHPGRNRKVLEEIRNRLLNRLFERGAFDKETLTLALAEPLPDSPHPLPRLAPHLLDRVAVSEDGQFFETTIDSGIQRMAEEKVRRHGEIFQNQGVHNTGVIIIELSTGEITAYVGNLNYESMEHENKVDMLPAERSTGSLLKPLLFAAALDSGELLPTRLIRDVPLRFGDFYPENSTLTYEGMIPANVALARSLNVPMVSLLMEYGLSRFYNFLQGAGMEGTLHRPPDLYGLTLILGGAETTLEDITTIYVNLGRSALGLPEISTPASYVQGSPSRLRAEGVVSRGSAWLTLQAMEEVNRPGEERGWRNYDSARRIAWKTGTSYGQRDAWSVGVTLRYAVGVWVGNSDGRENPSLKGIFAAAPLMFDLLNGLDGGGWFPLPYTELKYTSVCSESGYPSGAFCAETTEIFTPIDAPLRSSCPFCREIGVNASGEERLDTRNADITEITMEKRFVLPPAEEWFYMKIHPDYRSLPPYRETESGVINERPAFSLVNPIGGSAFYLPVDLDGTERELVMQAYHSDDSIEIFWHLDGKYLGMTTGLHTFPILPDPGTHTVLLIDGLGSIIERQFTIRKRE